MATRNPRLQRTPHSRMWLIEDGAGPASRPLYSSLARPMGVTMPLGDLTPVRIPDPDQYGKFQVVDKIRGEPGLITTNLQNLMTRDPSSFLRMARKGCEFDVQSHIGVCKNPQDFNLGWEKIHVLEGCQATQYSTGELGALQQGQDAEINEELQLSANDYYEIKTILPTELATSEIVQEVVGVNICDTRQCGECGIPSNGCQRVIVVQKSHAGSPGLVGKVIYSANQGSTWATSYISTLAANKDPKAAACVGVYYVVVSEEEFDIHYTLISDLFNGTATWNKVTTGFVEAGAPRAISSIGSAFTWMAGLAGYVYFASDITAGVTVQSAGVATAQDLNDIHAYDELNVIAVGNSNAVIFTQDGGVSWTAVTGPAVGVNLNAVWMRTPYEWIIGTANGKFYYTRDRGVTWSEKQFSGSGAGSIQDIVFATKTVGYAAHKTATPRGRILRTVDGGFSWYALPEQSGITIPANDQINVIAACGEDVNLVIGGGLGDNATDGFLVKLT